MTDISAISATERASVEKLADDFLASYRAGGRPSVEDYARRYPELADQLRGLLATLTVLEQHVPPPRRVELTPSGAPAAPQTPPTIGDFTIVREIGRGGMGIVYEAVQQSLGRHVALKVLSTLGMFNPSHLERFHLEARAAARLQHPHIVPVYGVGEHEGVHYYAMQFVAGQSLDLVIQTLRERLGVPQPDGRVPPPDNGVTPPSDCTAHDSAGALLTDRRQFYKNVAHIGLQVADALAYAHAEGILHRDIKPSNLLVDASGNIWVTDFGLAKAEGTELTDTGGFVGTLRYMAPERLDGWADRRSDLYSLGVTLYELLTLRPFFETTSRAELMRRIAHDQPLAPSKIDPAVPADLETIVLKALAKEPAARYHQAEQMADDLRRFLDDRPILARRPRLVERLGRWSRRNPAVAALAGIVAVLLAAAVVILTVSNSRIRRESHLTSIALQEKHQALVEKDRALLAGREQQALERSRFYAAQMNLAQTAWEAGQPSRTVELLESLRPWPGEPDIRGFEWYYLYHLNYRNMLRSWRCDGDGIAAVAWSGDGALVATASASSSVRLWDAQTGEHRQDLLQERGSLAIEFSPDRSLLAAGSVGPRGYLTLWNTSTGREQLQQLAHEDAGGLRALAFSPDAKWIATGAAGPASGNRGEIKLWNVADGRLIATLNDHNAPVVALAFSPDGRTLASAALAGDEKTGIILWDVVPDGEDVADGPNKRAEITGSGASALVFSHDGNMLYAAGHSGIPVIDVATATLHGTLEAHSGPVSSIRLVPGANRLVSTSDDRTVRLWDLEQKTSVLIAAELAPATSLAVDPQGKQVVCADNQGWANVRSLDFPDNQTSLQLRKSINAIAFTPDCRSLVLADSPLRVLDAATLKARHESPEPALSSSTLPESTLPQLALSVSPSGEYAATFNGAGQCKIKSVTTGADVAAIDVESIDHAVFSPDGKLVAAWQSGDPTNFGVWDVQTGTQRERFLAGDSRCAVFSPDSRHLALGQSYRDVLTYDLSTKTWTETRVANQLVRVEMLSYAPDGQTLAAGLSDGRIVLIDVKDATHPALRSRLSGHSAQVVAMTASPDSRVLATAAADRTIRLWEIATGQERATFHVASVVKHLAFSADGAVLATVDRDNTLRLMRADRDAAARSRRTWRDQQDPHSPDQLAAAACSAWEAGDLAAAKSKLQAAVDTLSTEPGPAASEHARQLLVRCKCLLYLAQQSAQQLTQKTTPEARQAQQTLADARRLLDALPDRLQELVGMALIDEGPALPEQRKLVDTLNFRPGEVWVYRGMHRPAAEEAQALADVNKGLALEPTNARILWMRGFMLAGWGRWDEAMPDLTSARRQLREARLMTPPQLAFRDWLVAMAYIARDDHTAYAQACTEALSMLATESDQDARGRLLWLCTATPHALDDPSRLAEFADSVLPASVALRTSEQLLHSGAAHFRAGALPLARERLEQSIHLLRSGEKPFDPMTGAFARLLLSMTYSRLGLPSQAKATLAESIHMAKNTHPPCWGDEFQFAKLQTEAQALIGELPARNRPR